MKLSKTQRKVIANVQLVGGKMSNLCFNLRQCDELTEHDKDTMDALYKEWDAANLALHKVMNPTLTALAAQEREAKE